MSHDPFKEFLFLKTSSTVAPQPPLSFSIIIEQDHSRINAVALQLRKLLSLKKQQCAELRQQQLKGLQVVAWRLVRHDISEHIVMRPAFVQYLGSEGEAMIRHDRDDHDHARRELLDLYSCFEQLRPDDMSGFKKLRQRYIVLMKDLTEHMKSESGTNVPRLESVLGNGESEELGRQYLRTKVLKPDLELQGIRVWKDVSDYINETSEGLWNAWRRLEVEEAKKDSKL